MKILISIFWLLLFAVIVTAQKAEYKDGILSIDGKNVAKFEKIKDQENLGLTSTYEVSSMSGEKLIIASYAQEFVEDPNNTADYYYRLTFLTADQIGVFMLAKLGTEKSLSKLLGASGIFTDTGVDAGRVKEFIARKGVSPRVAIDYTIVSRDRSWPIELQENKTIEQNGKIIGSWKDVSIPDKGMDSYEIKLPTEVLIAKVNFTGGNNAASFEIHTLKDNNERIVPLPSEDKYEVTWSAIDRNKWALERLIKWLVGNQYL